MDGLIVKDTSDVMDVGFSQGSNTIDIYGSIFRVGKIVYYNIYATGTFNNDAIITVTTASDRPKSDGYFSGVMGESGWSNVAAIFRFNTSGEFKQATVNDSNSKYVAFSGCYVAIG